MTARDQGSSTTGSLPVVTSGSTPERAAANTAELSWIERQFVRIAWNRMEGKVKGLKRWAPVIATGVLAGAAIARAFGKNVLADSLESAASATGLTGQSAATSVEISAAIAGLVGVGLKVYSQFRKALEDVDKVGPR